MQLEKMTAQVRPRSAWEAVDLGFMMLQHWYRPVIIGWLLITLPVFIIINVLLYQHPFWAALIFWWLLPVFDRIPMHILSRALFGEMVTSRSLLNEWHSIFLPHILKMLTIHRFDFTRSFNLPVWQLEKLSGRARAQRTRVLKKTQSSNAVGLSTICLAIEFIVFVSLYGLVMMFLPNYYAGQMMTTLFHSGHVWWAGPLANSFIFLTLMLVEPFYVAGGFSLYINRRTQLEGWDIEINFRQLAQRVGTLARHAAVLACCMLALQATVLLYPSPAHAAVDAGQADSVQSATNNSVARKAIEKIMLDKAFHHKQKIAGWELKHKREQNKQTEKFKSDWSGLSWLGNSLAQIGQLFLWVLVAALVVAVAYYFSKWRPTAGYGKKSQLSTKAPKSMFGLDITPASLPDDVGATALELWRAGKMIDALSLLYRGALTTLVHRDGINLRGSATEGDCIRIVSRHAEKIATPTTEFFRLLTRQWQYAAYAHRKPDDAIMHDLCKSWGQHFGVIK